jgi:hypothetical protein
VRPGEKLDAIIMTPGGAFDVTISAPARATLSVETRPVATGFERRADAPVLVCHTTGVLPIRISTEWRRSKVQSTQVVARQRATTPNGSQN